MLWTYNYIVFLVCNWSPLLAMCFKLSTIVFIIKNLLSSIILQGSCHDNLRIGGSMKRASSYSKNHDNQHY